MEVLKRRKSEEDMYEGRKQSKERGNVMRNEDLEL